MTRPDLTSGHLRFDAGALTTSPYPPLKKDVGSARKFKFSLDDRPTFKKPTRRRARRGEADPTDDSAAPRRQQDKSFFFFVDKSQHSFHRRVQQSPRSTARLDNSDIADLQLRQQEAKKKQGERRDSSLRVPTGAEDAGAEVAASSLAGLEQSGADQEHGSPGDDDPMQTERSEAGLRAAMPRREPEEAATNDGAPLASKDESFLNSLCDVAVNEKAEAPNQVIPNVEVKYNSRSRRSRKASPLGSTKQVNHEPVKQTLLRLPSPAAQMPLASWQRSKPLAEL